MAKKIVGLIKLQVPAGKANPSPPIGPALGQRGLNIMEFCKAFNAQTSSMEPGLVLPVVITAFADKSFTFVLKSPPASVLIKKTLKLDKGSAKPHTDKVGKLTRAQAEEIAKAKQPDLTAADLDAAVRTIAAGAPAHLRPDGWLVVEHGFDQGAAVRRLFADSGFVAIATRCDLAGHGRATAGRRGGTA